MKKEEYRLFNIRDVIRATHDVSKY